MSKRSANSKRWLDRQRRDSHVKAAKVQGYRSRAVFKLQQIQDSDRLIKAGMTVVDLGAAPGSWSQVASEWLGKKGQLFALDILPMAALNGVSFLQGDFTDETCVTEFLALLNNKKVDIVLSDMAPNLSGIRDTDQAKIYELAHAAFNFCQQTLKSDGALLIKVFQGDGFEDYMQLLRQHFAKVITRKPKASRDESREVYLLARGFITSS